MTAIADPQEPIEFGVIEMTHTPLNEADIAQVHDFVLAERRKCLSDREWQFRLRGYGYGLRASGRARVVTALLKGADLFEIDEAMLNAPSVAAG
jgi:hypothetical protein